MTTSTAPSGLRDRRSFGGRSRRAGRTVLVATGALVASVMSAVPAAAVPGDRIVTGSGFGS